MQMLGHAHQTGALHINSGDTDALLFFDAGAITHAECGSLFGDEAVIHILKNCFKNNSGVYKFVYGSASTQRTVLRSATDLMLDAMREVDESTRETEEVTPSDLSSGESHPPVIQETPGLPEDTQASPFSAPAQTAGTFSSAPESEPVEEPESDPAQLVSEDASASIRHSNDFSAAPLPAVESEVTPTENSFEAAQETHDEAHEHSDDFAAIADVLDRFAMTHSNDFSAADHESENSGVPESLDHLAESNSFNNFTGVAIPDESAASAPVENSEVPATDDQTDDQPLVTRPEEAL
jgi:hypothetical protein